MASLSSACHSVDALVFRCNGDVSAALVLESRVSAHSAVTALNFIGMVLCFLCLQSRNLSYVSDHSLLQPNVSDLSLLQPNPTLVHFYRNSFRYSSGKPGRQSMSPTCCSTAPSECGRQAWLLLHYRCHSQQQTGAATIDQLHDVAADGERYYRVI